MSVFNEYSTLKSVMIGKCYSAEILQKLFNNDKSMSKQEIDCLCRVNEETNEDLDAIQSYLENNGVHVYRPDIDKIWEIETKLGRIPTQPGSVRDWMFAYGDLILIGQVASCDRTFEYMFWEDAFCDMTTRFNKLILSVPIFKTEKINQTAESNTYRLPLSDGWREADNMTKIVKDNLNRIDNPLCENDKFYPWKMDQLVLEQFLGPWEEHPENIQDHYIYKFSEYSNKFLTHGAAFFKHDNIIFGFSSPHTYNGLTWFVRTIKKFYPSTEFIFVNGWGHIDGCMTIVDKNLALLGEEVFEVFIKNRIPSLEYIKVPGQCRPLFYMLQEAKNKQWIDQNYFADKILNESTDINKLISSSNSVRLTEYFKQLRGYDQRVDFDVNSLTVSPNKVIAGMFDKNKLAWLDEQGVEIINLPMRHRWVIDGGIHCYTNDIERE